MQEQWQAMMRERLRVQRPRVIVVPRAEFSESSSHYSYSYSDLSAQEPNHVEILERRVRIQSVPPKSFGQLKGEAAVKERARIAGNIQKQRLEFVKEEIAAEEKRRKVAALHEREKYKKAAKQLAEQQKLRQAIRATQKRGQSPKSPLPPDWYMK